MKTAHLIYVDAETNRNCEFNMTQLSDACFETETKRVSANGFKKKYPMKFWEKVYNGKIMEGFTDKTDNVVCKVSTLLKYKPIEDDVVGEMFGFIQSCARKVVKDSYTVSYEQVSEHMIEEARSEISRLASGYGTLSVTEANDILRNLFIIIPRKMKNVSDMLINEGNYQEVIEREQDLLDVMSAQVMTMKPHTVPDKTILETLGLEIRQCTKEESDMIKEKMGPVGHRFVRAFRVKNLMTEARFQSFMKERGMDKENIHYYYHGSKNMNYYGLTTQGPKLNPDAPITGKMFGYGFYLANKARKSINYTSVPDSIYNNEKEKRAYLAVYKTAYKNPMHVKHHRHEMCRYTEKLIRPYDALFAHGGADLVNDEIIVYNESQVTIQYLIEIK